jgi:hypothetical protein
MSMGFTVEIFALLLLAAALKKAHSDTGAILPIGPVQFFPNQGIIS